MAGLHAFAFLAECPGDVGPGGLRARLARAGRGGHTELYRGAEYVVDFLPKVKIEIITSDSLAPSIIHTLEKTAKTGHIGDGKILVTTVEDVGRIRTGERGEGAV